MKEPHPDRCGDGCDISVVICAYNAERTIETALQSLAEQQTTRSVEIVVVDSGTDGTARLVEQRYPEVVVVRSRRRLWPGSARNAGIRASRGRIIAFVPADGIAGPIYIEARIDGHEQGFDLMGGSITNGTPKSLIGTAAYLLEFSSLQPSPTLLAQQQIPHSLSYRREVFDRLGYFPEDVRTGEDTVFNRRCLESGLSLGFAPQAQVAHLNPRSVHEFWSHAALHGRGLARCIQRHGLNTIAGPLGPRRTTTAIRIFAAYPLATWLNALRALHHDHRRFASYVLASPLIWLGLLATAIGVWAESGAVMADQESSGTRPP